MTRYQPNPQEQAQRKKEALAERVEKLSRVRILEAIRKKLPDALSRPDLEMVARDYFRRLGHDNHRRLSKVYAWEEKKSKSSWGAETVDYEKRVSGFVLANPELNWGCCSASHENRRRPSFPRCLCSCFRLVLPQLQPGAIAREKLEPCACGRPVQSRFHEDRRRRPRRIHTGRSTKTYSTFDKTS